MLTLELDKAELKVVNGNRYYVFPPPPTHTNQNNRPSKYAEKKDCKVYTGRGNNNEALLHPDVMTPANALMTAFLEYGRAINDNSFLSAVIQSGWRADDASEGEKYLYNIKTTVRTNKLFENLTFPSELEAEAKGVLGRRGDPRRNAFRARVAASPGWTPELMQQLFQIVDNHFAPRGSNPHSTGFVFDLNFTTYYSVCTEMKGSNTKCVDSEIRVDANTSYNRIALRSAAGMWLNKYAMHFNFDSYDTSKEIWHLEYRQPFDREGRAMGPNFKSNGSFPVSIK
jgi:hypothetical protein